MKIAQYNDMMSYLTRPGFKDGDTVVPPPKPLTESQVKNKLDLYIKGFIGGFDKMEMIDLMNEISKKADESGVMSQEDVFNFVQERKNFYQKFLEENKGEAVEFSREEFAEGTKFIDVFGKELLDKLSQEKFGVNFDNLPTEKNDPKREVGNFKRRILKFQNFIKENNRQPTEEEARKLGRVQRDKTIAQTDKPEVTEADKREELRRKNKYAQLFKGKLIFADKSIQDEFENELKKRYSVARTSGKAKELGVLSDKEIYEKFLKPAGFSPETTRSYITNYKKILDQDFIPLTTAEKDATKVQRQILEGISQKGKRISGTEKNPVHHLFPLGDEIDMKPRDFTVIPQKLNSALQSVNKDLRTLINERTQLINDISSGNISTKQFDFRNNNITKRAQELINNHYKKNPSHKGLLNFKTIDVVMDDQNRFLNVVSKGTIGGDYKKWTLDNIDKTILDKNVANLDKNEYQVENELKNLRSAIKKVSVSRDASLLPNKNLAKEQIKNMDLKDAGQKGMISTDLLKDLGKFGLKTIGSFPVAVGLAADTTKKGLEEGKSFIDAVTQPMVGVDLLYPEVFKKLGPLMAKAARVSTPIGAGITGIGILKDRAKNMINQAEAIAATEATPYQQDLIEDFAKQYKGFEYGGRVGYADGPDDPGKRKFMKIMMGGLASLPILSRFFRVGEIAAPVAEKAVETVSKAPKYFFDLVNKIKLLGTESKIKPSERMTEINYTGMDGSQYTLTEDSVTGLQRIEKDKIGGYSDENVSFDTIENKSVMEYQPSRRTEDGVEPEYYDEGTADFDPDGTVGGFDDGIEDDIIEQIKKEVDDKG